MHKGGQNMKRNNQINILFLGGAKRVSIANHFKKAAMGIGYEVNIFSYELDEKVAIATVGKVIIGKRWKDENLLSDLKMNIDKFNINIVLAFVDPAISIISKLKELCPDVFIPVSDFGLCNIMFDKVLSANWFSEHNISQPLYYTNPDEINYPVILKPRRGSASKGIIICRSKEELPNVDYDQYLISEYISDHTEYSVDCYVNRDGEVTSVVPRIRLETAGGEAIRSKTIKDKTIIEESMKILMSGHFRGPITIQYIRDNTNGKVYVMEINPRLGGAVVTSIGAGSGIIKMILDEYLGNEVTPKTDWRDNTLMVRYFNEVIF